jgi:ABC-type transport system involved in multi-copper enzyme maturation permease subunit
MERIWSLSDLNGRRIWAIAYNAFLEIWRAKVGYLLLVYAAGLVLGMVLVPFISAGNSAGKILLDGCLAATTLLGLLVTVLIGTRLVDREIERRTILLAIAKPLSRTEFMLGKHLGLSLMLAALVGGATLIQSIGLSLWGKASFEVGAIALTALFAWLELVTIAAVALLFGSFTSPLLAVVLTLAIYVMGHLSRNLLTIGIQLKDPTLQRLTEGLYLVLPDLERFNLKNLAVYGLLPENSTLLADALYGVLYCTVLLCTAIFAFSRREF